jgi:hypothetical protein
MKRTFIFLLLGLSILCRPLRAGPLEPKDARRITQGAVVEIVRALAGKDFRGLATFVGPEGLIVSPYVMLDGGDVRLSHAEVEHCATDRQMRHWGARDGSGDPIEITCNRYFDEFVWTADYRKADEVLYNEPRQRGNEINNSHEAVPDGIVVELHIRADDREGAFSWKSLRLIFRKSDQHLFLIAITRDVWTI